MQYLMQCFKTEFPIPLEKELRYSIKIVKINSVCAKFFLKLIMKYFPPLAK